MTGNAVQFVCTGKSRHQKRYPRVTFWDSGIQFKCTYCDRDLQMRADRFETVVADLRTAGIVEVDISVLPY